MKFLQNIVAFLMDTFPLHRNKTVEDLEDALEDTFEALAHEELTNLALEQTNNQYRKANLHLEQCLRNVEQEASHYRRNLEELYRAQIPVLTHWPMNERCESVRDLNLNRIQFRLMLSPSYLEMSITPEITEGNHYQWRELFAEEVSQQYRRASKAATLTFLNDLLN